jgi:DNA (cytosine-5)-methyltransferase 1
MEKYTLVDLCAGTGAFSLAFHNTNKVKTIFANDFDKNSKIIYDDNFQTKLTCIDLHKLNSQNDIPKMDILTSGFSCQPFSVAGLQNGFEDERSDVFWKIMDIIKIHNPRIVIFENVKNLKSHDNGNTFKKIINEIEKLNYKHKHAILNTSEITKIPQNRERIYIVCFKNINDYNLFQFPKPINETEKLKIINIIDNNVDDKYYYNTEKYKVFDEIKKGVIKHIKTNTLYQYRRFYVRENKNNECPTLTANMGSGGHNVGLLLDDKGIRKLTPRECFKFQGFPDTYKLTNKLSNSALYKLAGNAVTYLVVEKLANIIVNILSKNDNLEDDSDSDNSSNESNNDDENDDSDDENDDSDNDSDNEIINNLNL